MTATNPAFAAEAQIGSRPAGVLAGAGNPVHGVDADQPAPGSGLAPGADHHAQGKRDQGQQGGPPKEHLHLVRPADEAGGDAEGRIDEPGTQQRLPQLIRIGGAGEAPAGTPGQQERDERQAQRDERERARFRTGRGAFANGGQVQGHAVDDQPRLAGKARQDVEMGVAETGRCPHRRDGRNDRQGGNDCRLG